MMMNKSSSFNRSTNISGSFRGSVNASFRSTPSESSFGGYETPEEGPESEVDVERDVDRAVQFMNQVREDDVGIADPTDNTNMDNSSHSHGSSHWWGDKIDRKKCKPHFHRPKLGKSVLANCFRRYPRVYACTCGIVIPLWILIALCLLCGKFLADFEYEAELDANDAAMRVSRVALTYEQMVSDIIHNLPLLCYMLYRNRTDTEDIANSLANILAEQESLAAYMQIQPNVTGHTIVNVTKFADFMSACGNRAETYATDVLDSYFEVIDVDRNGDTSMSFNWNRCLNQTQANETQAKRANRILVPNDQDVELTQPSAQAAYYEESWNRNFESRRQEDLNEVFSQESFGLIDMRRMIALNRSLYEATGREGCITNVASSAWFWFTIMTTVGYGNQAPSSVGGRAMVFTAGFVCILLFASILATTGTIISHIVFDITYRLKMKFLTRKEIMAIVWGLLWCIWMIFMSAMYMEWTQRRLYTKTRWQDAYWFSYISTTTVGLGDNYQTPEVLFINDLLYFSLSYLFGFVLLSTFLTELGNMVAQYIPDVSVELGKRLQHVGAIPYILDGSRLDDSVQSSNHNNNSGLEYFQRNGNFSVEKSNKDYDA